MGVFRGYHLGRLIDHIGLRSADYPAARAFYLALFEVLGLAGDAREGEGWLEMDEFCLGPVTPGESAPVSRLHLCFQAVDRAMVQRFHRAGLAAGGQDAGAPGLRDYHPGYYAAFLRDPDGNVIEAKVDERISARSAPVITVETGPEALAVSETAPILRIYDEAAARDFYLGFLGASVLFEHRFGPDAPLYMGIRLAGATLHLSGHYGDATPGATVLLRCSGLAGYQAALLAKRHRHCRPGIEAQDWGSEMTVTDPFGNRLRFLQS